MKKIIYTLSIVPLFLLLTSLTHKKYEAEGINFFEGTWQEELKKIER
jgi:hypothetical protein